MLGFKLNHVSKRGARFVSTTECNWITSFYVIDKYSNQFKYLLFQENTALPDVGIAIAMYEILVWFVWHNAFCFTTS